MGVYNTIGNRYCHTDCSFSDGMVYTSNPAKCKCEITGEYHYFGDECNITKEQRLNYENRIRPINNEIYADKEKDIKAGSITVKGFDSLVNALKVLLDNHYKILIKKDGFNKYNESTLLTIEYYTEHKEPDKVVQEAYHDYLVNKALTNSQNKSNKTDSVTLNDITRIATIPHTEINNIDLSISGSVTDDAVMGSTITNSPKISDKITYTEG